MKLKVGIIISFFAFIGAMFLPSFQGIDTKNFEYKQLNYFELVKEKWWIYLLLLIILMLVMTLSLEKSKMASIVFVSGFVFSNLSILSLMNLRLFVNGYPILWGYYVTSILGLLVSIMLVLYAHRER